MAVKDKSHAARNVTERIAAADKKDKASRFVTAVDFIHKEERYYVNT